MPVTNLRVYYTTIVIVIIVLCNRAYCQFIAYPNNPCPSFFQYFRNNERILGYLEFPNDNSGTYETSMNMSLAAEISSNQNIRLELRTSAIDLVNGKPVTYFVHFPIQEVLPKPTRIVFNNQLYCTGPPEDLTPGGTVTNMWATTFFKISTTSPSPQKPSAPNFFLQVGDHNFNQGYFTIPTLPPSPSSSQKTGSNFFFQFGDPNPAQGYFTLPTPPPSPFFPSKPRPAENVDLSEGTKVSVVSEVNTGSSVKPPKPTHSTTSPFTNPPVENCGYSKVTAQNLVVNGNNVKDGEFPWLVAIMYRQNYDYKYRCTGSLISRRHVITAGHCVQYYRALLFPIEDYLLVFGKINIRSWANDAVLRDAKTITVHPNYQQSNGDYDVAIIKLDKDLELANTIKPVCIWNEDETLDKVVGQQGTVVGWGKDEDQNQFVPDAKSISMPIVSQVECLRSDPGFASVTSARTFCAGKRDGSGPCTGDSGGGFFMTNNGRWTLRGVVSLSLGESGECDTSKYFVFVDAAKLRDWIIASIA